MAANGIGLKAMEHDSTEPLKIRGLPIVGTWPAGGLAPLHAFKRYRCARMPGAPPCHTKVWGRRAQPLGDLRGCQSLLWRIAFESRKPRCLWHNWPELPWISGRHDESALLGLGWSACVTKRSHLQEGQALHIAWCARPRQLRTLSQYGI